MSVDSERKLQNRVKGWLINDLHYTYLGNLESLHNKPVKEDLLRKNLQARGYSRDAIGKAITALLAKVGMLSDDLTQDNMEVYSLLRYGCQGIKDEHDTYPEGIRDSAARRAIYDYLECNYELTIGVDGAIRISVSPDWHTNHQRTQKVRIAIYKTLSDASVKKAKVEEQRDGIFDIAKRQEEYDR